MGANDAAEMLLAAQDECIRLEGELDAALTIITNVRDWNTLHNGRPRYRECNEALGPHGTDTEGPTALAADAWISAATFAAAATVVLVSWEPRWQAPVIDCVCPSCGLRANRKSGSWSSTAEALHARMSCEESGRDRLCWRTFDVTVAVPDPAEPDQTVDEVPC